MKCGNAAVTRQPAGGHLGAGTAARALHGDQGGTGACGVASGFVGVVAGRRAICKDTRRVGTRSGLSNNDWNGT
jgi:hypothetical protein